MDRRAKAAYRPLIDQHLTSQELSLLRVLQAELDEHKRKRTMSIAEYAKANHNYQKLLSRFGQYGAEENAA